jgi:hypothetical protein
MPKKRFPSLIAFPVLLLVLQASLASAQQANLLAKLPGITSNRVGVGFNFSGVSISADAGRPIPNLFIKPTVLAGQADYDCDASLQRRLVIGAVTGAIVGTAMYAVFLGLTSNIPGKRSTYAVAIIVPATVLGAVREAQHPSRLSCPHGSTDH